MKKTSFRMNPVYLNLKSMFKYSFSTILIFEICLKLLLFLFVSPLLRSIINRYIGLSETPTLFNASLMAFFANPFGVLAVLFFAFISALLIYYEFAVLSIFIYSGSRKQSLKLFSGLRLGLQSLPNLLHISSLGFMLFALLLLPLLRIGFASSLIPGFHIPDFISGELTKTGLGLIANDLILYIPILVFFCFSFTIPCMVLENVSFGKAVKRNFSILRQGFRQLLVVFLSTLFLLLLSQMATYALGSTQSPFLYSLTGMLINTLQIISTPLLLSVIILCYLPYGKVQLAIQPSALSTRPAGAGTPLKIVALVTLLGLLLFTVTQQKSPYSASSTTIIGHRGCLGGVENSIEAVMEAQKQGADYVEIDILLSKDNVPMVVHDTNLLRLTGKNAAVSKLTAAQLTALPLAQGEHQSTIPSLDQMLTSFQNTDLRFLIELKAHGQESTSVVEQVARVIEQNQMQQRCIFQTSDQNLLEEMKEKYPSYPIGQIVIFSLGKPDSHFFSENRADFFSVEDSLITPQLVQSCQSANKYLYVWTVNDPDRVAYLAGLGVSGIITDYPEKVRETIMALSSQAELHGGEKMAFSLD